MHEQSRQNKAFLESAEKKITDKVESIHANVEMVLEMNNSRISECESRVMLIEERVQVQATRINEFVSKQEQRLDYVNQQINRLQRSSVPASKTTYIYITIHDSSTQVILYGNEAENSIQFLKPVSYTHLDVYKRQPYTTTLTTKYHHHQQI